jgi:hypothetical protein
MCEMMTPMQDVIAFVKENPGVTIDQALVSLTQSFQQQLGQNPNQQGQPNPALVQQMQQGRMMNGPMMAMSPAMQNSLLPGGVGSPHMGTPNPMNAALLGNHSSPAQQQVAPPMISQASQQGNAPASTNTSPAGGKRRRSVVPGIKDEDNGANGTGAAKVKASPRMSNNAKRAKQN